MSVESMSGRMSNQLQLINVLLSVESMSGRVSNQLPNNLPQLQNLIKRDPESYKDEFLQQFRLEKTWRNPSNQNVYVELIRKKSYYKNLISRFKGI